MSIDELLKAFSEKEEKELIYSEKVKGVPIWRLVRFNIRVQFLRDKTGNYTNKTTKKKTDYKRLILFYFKSLFSLLNLFIFGKKRKNIFFAFPRLTKFENVFMDKFTDPVISLLNIQDSSLIFQRSLGGNHLLPRYHSKNIVYTDFFDLTSRVFALIFFPLFFIIYLKKVITLSNKACKIHDNIHVNIFKTILVIGIFKVNYVFYYLLFLRLRPSNLFMVDRIIFMAQINVAKNLNIKTFEFQHGITRTETPLYTGSYHDTIDPDLFLAFGDEWINPFFGIDEGKIVNIGWAYSEFLKRNLSFSKIRVKDSFLVISEPDITDWIVNFVCEAATAGPHNKFVLRLHPQEELNEMQRKKIASFNNIDLDDKTQDSIYSILKFNFVIGVNSSVLFEALSFEKKVGIINFMDLFSKNIDQDKKFGFYIINNFDDLDKMRETGANKSNTSFYSMFNPNLLNSLTNE